MADVIIQKGRVIYDKYGTARGRSGKNVKGEDIESIKAKAAQYASVAKDKGTIIVDTKGGTQRVIIDTAKAYQERSGAKTEEEILSTKGVIGYFPPQPTTQTRTEELRAQLGLTNIKTTLEGREAHIQASGGFLSKLSDTITQLKTYKEPKQKEYIKPNISTPEIPKQYYGSSSVVYGEVSPQGQQKSPEFTPLEYRSAFAYTTEPPKDVFIGSGAVIHSSKGRNRVKKAFFTAAEKEAQVPLLVKGDIILRAVTKEGQEANRARTTLFNVLGEKFKDIRDREKYITSFDQMGGALTSTAFYSFGRVSKMVETPIDILETGAIFGAGVVTGGFGSYGASVLTTGMIGEAAIMGEKSTTKQFITDLKFKPEKTIGSIAPELFVFGEGMKVGGVASTYVFKYTTPKTNIKTTRLGFPSQIDYEYMMFTKSKGKIGIEPFKSIKYDAFEFRIPHQEISVKQEVAGDLVQVTRTTGRTQTSKVSSLKGKFLYEVETPTPKDFFWKKTTTKIIPDTLLKPTKTSFIVSGKKTNFDASATKKGDLFFEGVEKSMVIQTVRVDAEPKYRMRSEHTYNPFTGEQTRTGLGVEGEYPQFKLGGKQKKYFHLSEQVVTNLEGKEITSITRQNKPVLRVDRIATKQYSKGEYELYESRKNYEDDIPKIKELLKNKKGSLKLQTREELLKEEYKVNVNFKDIEIYKSPITQKEFFTKFKNNQKIFSSSDIYTTIQPIIKTSQLENSKQTIKPETTTTQKIDISPFQKNVQNTNLKVDIIPTQKYNTLFEQKTKQNLELRTEQRVTQKTIMDIFVPFENMRYSPEIVKTGTPLSPSGFKIPSIPPLSGGRMVHGLRGRRKRKLPQYAPDLEAVFENQKYKKIKPNINLNFKKFTGLERRLKLKV